MRKAIAYYRVSTDRQGKSGLGLEVQAEAVNNFAKCEGYEVVDIFKETESGKRPERTELLAACPYPVW